MERIERASTKQWIWEGSSDPDLLKFVIIDEEGTVVTSVTATQSGAAGSGTFYAIESVPNSPGYFTSRFLAWASSKQYFSDELFKVIDVTAATAPSSFYASIAEVRDKLDALNAAGRALTNDIVSESMTDVQAKIDSCLARRYTLPFSSTPPVVKSLTKDLTVVDIAQRFVQRSNDGEMPEFLIEMRDQANELLDNLQTGSKFLVTASGTLWPSNIPIDEVTHIGDGGILPTFTELDSTLQRSDPDNLRSIFDETWDKS